MLLVLESRLYHQILRLFYKYTTTVVIGIASTERYIAIRSCILFEQYTKNVVIGVAGTVKSTLPYHQVLHLFYEYTKNVVIGVTCTERYIAIRSRILFEQYTKNVGIGVAGTVKPTLPPDLSYLFYEYTKTVVIGVACTERYIAIRSCILFNFVKYTKNVVIAWSIQVNNS